MSISVSATSTPPGSAAASAAGVGAVSGGAVGVGGGDVGVGEAVGVVAWLHAARTTDNNNVPTIRIRFNVFPFCTSLIGEQIVTHSEGKANVADCYVRTALTTTSVWPPEGGGTTLPSTGLPSTVSETAFPLPARSTEMW